MFLVRRSDIPEAASLGRSDDRGEAVAIMCAILVRSGYELEVIDTNLDDATVASVGSAD